MAAQSFTRRKYKSKFRTGFRILKRPIIWSAGETQSGGSQHAELSLPRAREEPMLVAIARDPVTIFACWSIDWPAVFAKQVPVTKQVYVRTHRADGFEEKQVSVEPMAGSCYVNVSDPQSRYQLEIGYYQPANVWNSVAASCEVTMPRHRMSEQFDADLAAIPFHLSFQRLLNLFGAAGGDHLAAVISRLEARASSGKSKVQPASEQILRAMNFSASEIAAAWRALDQIDREKLARRTGVLLRSDPTSPSRGYDSG